MKYTIYISTVLLLVVLYYLYNHIYIGINMHCDFCKENRGYHYHYILPISFYSKLNIASSGKHCDVCMDFPGQPHLHVI
jgi:hypothetical protein